MKGSIKYSLENLWDRTAWNISPTLISDLISSTLFKKSSLFTWFLKFFNFLTFNLLNLWKGDLSKLSRVFKDLVGIFLLFETSIKWVSLRTLSIIIKFVGLTKCASGIPISFLLGS